MKRVERGAVSVGPSVGFRLTPLMARLYASATSSAARMRSNWSMPRRASGRNSAGSCTSAPMVTGIRRTPSSIRRTINEASSLSNHRPGHGLFEKKSKPDVALRETTVHVCHDVVAGGDLPLIEPGVDARLAQLPRKGFHLRFVDAAVTAENYRGSLMGSPPWSALEIANESGAGTRRRFRVRPRVLQHHYCTICRSFRSH